MKSKWETGGLEILIKLLNYVEECDMSSLFVVCGVVLNITTKQIDQSILGPAFIFQCEWKRKIEIEIGKVKIGNSH